MFFLTITKFASHDMIETIIALDGRAVSARETLRQVTSMRFKDSNPKLVVERAMNYSSKSPFATFTFADGTEDTFDTQEYTAKEMLETVWMKTTGISCEYEIAGKSIDDEVS